MTQTIRSQGRRRSIGRCPFAVLAIAVCILAACSAARGENAGWIGGRPVVSGADTRAGGGVIAQSYAYHRQAPVVAPIASPVTAPAAQPAGWYGYGFPVQTYRWGWFGAAHYYPTVLWHQGYNGDECRWAYRRGY